MPTTQDLPLRCVSIVICDGAVPHPSTGKLVFVDVTGELRFGAGAGIGCRVRGVVTKSMPTASVGQWHPEISDATRRGSCTVHT